MDLIFFQFPGIDNVQCVFTGRGNGGGLTGNLSFQADEISARESRLLLMANLAPLGLKDVAECRQVHGDNLLLEPRPFPFTAHAMSCQAADGMMTAKAGLGLMIKTADCQPVLIASQRGAQVMALHVGWRGNRIDMPAKAIRVFCEQNNLEPRDLYAVRGPSLGKAEFINFEKEWGEAFTPWYDNSHKTMDLWRLTRYQLESAGILPANIYQIDICTYANHTRYFSWRGDKTLGRQAGLIWIKPSPPRKKR